MKLPLFGCSLGSGCLLAGLTGSLSLAGFAGSAWADEVSVDCRLKISREGINTVVAWQLPLECGTNLYLQHAFNGVGPWTTLSNATEPFLSPLNQESDSVFRAILILPEGAAGSAQMARSVRDFAFSTWPDLNPATEFDLRVEPVLGLWEALQMQVLTVRESVGSQVANEYACVLRNGRMQRLGQSFGGYGLMSGLTHGASFYFTYSWGSGLHRSHVGKLQVVNDEVKFWDSGGLFGLDVFVSRHPDGQILVQSGIFEGFNRWRKLSEFGRLDETDPPATKIIGLDGSVVATLVPATPGN